MGQMTTFPGLKIRFFKLFRFFFFLEYTVLVRVRFLDDAFLSSQIALTVNFSVIGVKAICYAYPYVFNE